MKNVVCRSSFCPELTKKLHQTRPERGTVAVKRKTQTILPFQSRSSPDPSSIMDYPSSGSSTQPFTPLFFCIFSLSPRLNFLIFCSDVFVKKKALFFSRTKTTGAFCHLEKQKMRKCTWRSVLYKIMGCCQNILAHILFRDFQFWNCNFEKTKMKKIIIFL